MIQLSTFVIVDKINLRNLLKESNNMELRPRKSKNSKKETITEKANRMIKKLIDGHLRKIKNNKQREAHFKKDPRLPDKIKIDDQYIIEEYVGSLKEVYNKLFPFVRNIRTSYVLDITDNNLNCAIYLLLCHVFETWKTVFLVAKNGMNAQMIILVRHIIETLDLVNFFIIKGEESKDLKRWFSGEIISNKKSRKAIRSFMEENVKVKNEIDFYNVKTYIYSILSQYPHSGYCILLESVDVFKKDFDFNNYSSFHFTKTNMGYTNEIMNLTIITMKLVFEYLKDGKTYAELDSILREREPHVSKEITKSLKEDFPKF